MLHLLGVSISKFFLRLRPRPRVISQMAEIKSSLIFYSSRSRSPNKSKYNLFKHYNQIFNLSAAAAAVAAVGVEDLISAVRPCGHNLAENCCGCNEKTLKQPPVICSSFNINLLLLKCLWLNHTQATSVKKTLKTKCHSNEH